MNNTQAITKLSTSTHPQANELMNRIITGTSFVMTVNYYGNIFEVEVLGDAPDFTEENNFLTVNEDTNENVSDWFDGSDQVNGVVGKIIFPSYRSL